MYNEIEKKIIECLTYYSDNQQLATGRDIFGWVNRELGNVSAQDVQKVIDDLESFGRIKKHLLDPFSLAEYELVHNEL
ncbi:hypothetical protein [Shouchella lehensis]|uniref:Uncharacterized protein n=1 Tax=Shouchella lehensis G1 TaxID=1246626 RepID=A0A060M5S4_9BACI|nr:hypothetical protein [Shouchella lehensis]AIC95434.1 hypothetical protein BleG1_2870 [Shouchella lehensis G1]